MKADCENVSEGNGCVQRCFDYKGHENALCGGNNFKIDRFYVLQMYETEEQKKRREERERLIDEERTQWINEQIESMCGLSVKTVIFDSTVDNWSQKDSVFDP